jgi:hypothetical protein
MKHTAKKKKRRGGRDILFLIFGTFAVLLGMGVYILVTGRITAALTASRLAGQAAYALMTASTTCTWVAFVLLEFALVLQFLPSEQDYEKKPNTSAPMLGEKKSPLGSKRAMNVITVVLIAGAVICGVVSINTYTVVSEDGITTHCLGFSDRYEWKQVKSYVVDCDSSRGLSVTYTMRDGKQFEILQHTVSAPEEFHKNYDSAVAFAAMLDGKMTELQIPRRVRNARTAESFYKGNYPTLWKHVSQLIDHAEFTPLPDETVGGTEAATEPQGVESNP